MKTSNPLKQTDQQIVETLQANRSRQYTEAAHAEMMRRFTQSIQDLKEASAKNGRILVGLTTTIVILTILNVGIAILSRAS